MLNFYRSHILNAANDQCIYIERYLHGAKKRDTRKIELEALTPSHFLNITP